MLEGGIIAKLLDEKWSTYAKVTTQELRLDTFPGILHEAAVHPAAAPPHHVHGRLPETRRQGKRLLR